MLAAWVAVGSVGSACYTFGLGYDYDTVMPEAAYDLPSRRIVLAPVTVPDDVEIWEDRVRRIDTLLYHKLLDAGYDVVPGSEYAAIWDSLTTAAGGFFDPYTGERNNVAYDSAVTVLFATLKERFNPQVLMYPELWVTEADVFSGSAHWDGYREPFGLRLDDGTVLALSLLLTAEDLTPREIFNNGTGVQIIERLGSDFVSMEVMPPELILADSSVVQAAVERVVQPLVELAARSQPPTRSPADTSRQSSSSRPSQPRLRNQM